jgi:mono/diheme cytochrome c family protein
MKLKSLLMVGAMSAGLASMAAFQDAKIWQRPLQPTPAGGGAEMFLDYCASCHGRDGAGSGPVSPALKARITDLTTLAKRNNGVFPTERVRATIRGDLLVVAHGSKDMPVWGPAFRYLGGGSHAEATVRVDSLTRYIESLQVAP